ncbi:MAG: helix-turn-helix domain-containing protein [Oligoflexales bacterium]
MNQKTSNFTVAKSAENNELYAGASSCGRLFENSDEWMTTFEAAAYLKISESSLLNLCCNGDLPYYKLGRSNRYKVEDLRNLIVKKRFL